jgi:hypothetical protein
LSMIFEGLCRPSCRSISCRSVRLLIDTHILLWADQRPRLIVPTLRAAMRHETNEIVVSAATVSEIGPYGVATLGLD